MKTDTIQNTIVSMGLKRLTFLHQWMKNPRSMASVTPSGRQLAQMMAAALPPDSRNVIELGAGTGAVTNALIKHGIAPSRLLAVETNPVLYRMLHERFPGLQVICGDARHLETLLDDRESFESGTIDAISSSLGLLAMPHQRQYQILMAAFHVLRPGGVFIQYTYGFTSPVNLDVCRRLGLQCIQAGLAWRNLPPARIWVYAKR